MPTPRFPRGFPAFVYVLERPQAVGRGAGKRGFFIRQNSAEITPKVVSAIRSICSPYPLVALRQHKTSGAIDPVLGELVVPLFMSEAIYFIVTVSVTSCNLDMV